MIGKMRCGEVTEEEITMVLQNAAGETATRLVPVGEASKILSVHPNTLRKWSDSGLIPSFRIGQRRDRRFAVSDLLAFIDRAGNGGASVLGVQAGIAQSG